jgi:Carboxypeptidase regulatory-like domain
MKPLSVILLLLISAFTCKAATFSGTVRDSLGAVIANAHVVIHWDPAGSNYLGDNVGIREDISVSTDSDGKFSLELPPGFYDVFVTATAFTPYCEKIRLKDRPKTYDVKLKVSPVASKELD